MAGMEIHQLEMLRELGALGSVKAVAETLLVTPSAVSQQLAALQKTVEVPLTRKEGRNLVLTEAGQVLADAGAAVVSAMADAKMAIGAYHGSPVAPVTLSGFHSAGQALFAPLARLLDGPGRPRILLSDEDVAQQDFPALTARYDLVLAHRMDHSPRWPEERVAVIPLAHEPLDVALPAGHRLAGQRAVTADDVVGEPWVTSRTGYSPADVLSAVAARLQPGAEHRAPDQRLLDGGGARGGRRRDRPAAPAHRAARAEPGHRAAAAGGHQHPAPDRRPGPAGEP